MIDELCDYLESMGKVMITVFFNLAEVCLSSIKSGFHGNKC